MRLSSAADSAVPFPSPFQPGRRPEDPLCAAAGPAESRALSARPGGFSGETPRLGRVAAGTDEDLWRGVFLRWEPGPGTRSRGVRKSRGGAVQEEKFLPVRCRENRIIPHQSCPREVLAVCHCGSRAARCAVKGCGGAGQGSPGCAETAGRLLVEQSQGQLLRCFRDGFLQDLFLVRPSLLPRPQRWSEFPSTRVCVQPGALGERVRAGRRLNGRAVSDCGTSWGCFDRVQPSFSPLHPYPAAFSAVNDREEMAVDLAVEGCVKEKEVCVEQDWWWSVTLCRFERCNVQSSLICHQISQSQRQRRCAAAKDSASRAEQHPLCSVCVFLL
ncbi:uncharacterized protein LOC135580679 isoform X3 [Columba livia]|uniref:uncharacterized protein LOC135580679 isoform X3 n=1 Tax=Columba livia TaxID=8932 RepID=UPI0031BBA5BA